MPPAASYATAADNPRTMVESTEGNRESQIASKFIRNHVDTSQKTQEMYQRPGPMDPRWADIATRPQAPPQQPLITKESFTPAIEIVEDPSEQEQKITAGAVANRIFKQPSDILAALDDTQSPVHNIALSLLSNRSISGTDRLIYILIICALAIMLVCALYKLNQQKASS